MKPDICTGYACRDSDGLFVWKRAREGFLSIASDIQTGPPVSSHALLIGVVPLPVIQAWG